MFDEREEITIRCNDTILLLTNIVSSLDYSYRVGVLAPTGYRFANVDIVSIRSDLMNNIAEARASLIKSIEEMKSLREQVSDHG